MRFRALLLTALFLLGAACASVAPTPVLIGDLIELNNETVQLYKDCSQGLNFVPEKEKCNPPLLRSKIDATMGTALQFISADIKQPQGYDIYLATAMLYFRVAQRNLNEYTRAEQIARQFFETQKAHSGRSLNDATFYLVWFTAATASKQYFEDPFTLTPNRKAELLFARSVGIPLLTEIEGPRLVRLHSALDTLKFISDSIE